MKRFAAAAAVFTLALGVRALTWPLVLEPGGVVPFGYDSYYHLRRILYSLVEFPAVLDFDPYLNFPFGAKPIWTPVFDWLVAALALPFVDPADPETLWRFAIWLPPLLGAATALVLMALVRRHFGAPESWLAGTLLALSSGHFWYSQLGFVDHHAAVALVATGAVFAVMNLLADIEADRSPWLAAAIAGGLLAGALLLWPGALLHVGLSELGLLLFLLTRTDRSRARTTAAALVVAHVVALAAVLPLCWNATWPQWGAYSPVVLTRFQPWLFAALATTAAACAAAWRSELAGASSGRRALSGSALGAAVLAGSAVLVPGLAEGAADAWLWFARREIFQSTVAESWPLFFDRDGSFVLDVAALRLTGFVFLAPFAIAWFASRRRSSAAVLLFLGWSAGLLLATVLQRRFFNTAAVAMSGLFAVSVVAAWRALPAGWRAGRRSAKAAAFVVAVALLVAPSLVGYRFFIRNQTRAIAGAKLGLVPEMVSRRIALETAEWMEKATPPTAGWLDADARPEYGVMAPWTLGHIIETVGRRPTTVTNFGDDIGPENFEKMERYYRGREAEGAPRPEDLGVRYVIAQRSHRFLGAEPPDRGSLFHSLWYLDGARADGASGPQVPGLARHRLVFESRPMKPGAPPGPAVYKVFEFVPGAELVGRGPAGARVRAQLPLRSNWMRPFSFESETEVGPDGIWRLRVPYATRGGPPSVRAIRPYALACEGETATLHVDERAVRSGASVDAPELCRR